MSHFIENLLLALLFNLLTITHCWYRYRACILWAARYGTHKVALIIKVALISFNVKKDSARRIWQPSFGPVIEASNEIRHTWSWRRKRWDVLSSLVHISASSKQRTNQHNIYTSCREIQMFAQCITAVQYKSGAIIITFFLHKHFQGIGTSLPHSIPKAIQFIPPSDR